MASVENTVIDNTVTTDVGTKRDRTSLRRWLWTILAFALFAVSITGIVIRMPYVAFLPGDAFETESRIEVECDGEGVCLEGFPSGGEVFFTTVSVRQEPSFWEYLWLRNNDDVELETIEEALGDRTSKENDQFNAELMTASKDVAVAVALEELGYEAITEDAVFVRNVIEETAAEGVLEPGDRLVAIDGSEVASLDSLFSILAEIEPEDTVDVAYARVVEDEELVSEETLTLGVNPDDESRAFLGIQPLPTYDFADFDFSVNIDSADVGGPSAGLAFALATLDYLTEGDLTGGNDVAVTGTISPSGAVGPIGGVLQKVAAVREQGIDLFIVPDSQSEEELSQLEQVAGPDLKVVPVGTLEEALEALEANGGDIQSVRDFDSGDL